jgi:hypothetical protein
LTITEQSRSYPVITNDRAINTVEQPGSYRAIQHYQAVWQSETAVLDAEKLLGETFLVDHIAAVNRSLAYVHRIRKSDRLSLKNKLFLNLRFTQKKDNNMVNSESAWEPATA